MTHEKTLTLIIRILEDCLENDYSSEELRSKIRDILQLLGGSDGRRLQGRAHRLTNGLYPDFESESL